MARRYKLEVHDFIRAHTEEFTIREMAIEVNKRFDVSFTYSSMKSYFKRHKLRAGKKQVVYSKLFPKEAVDVILANYKGRTYAEMLEMLRNETGKNYTKQQINGYYKNHKLNSGMTGRFKPGCIPTTKGKKWDDYMSKESQERSRSTCYKAGHTPDNRLPVGSIRVRGDGYLIKKVQERGSQWDRWKPLHKLTWEEHNGPIPKGMNVGFKDLNIKNCSIDNLYLLTKAENLRMNAKGFRSSIPEATEAGLNTIRLNQAIRDRRKQR